MSQVASRAALVAGLLVTASVCAPYAHAATQLTVRVYGEHPWGDAAAVATAIETASGIIRETGIDARWLDCRGPMLPEACTTMRGPRDLVVRLTSQFAAAVAASGEALRADDGESSQILGVAVVDRRTHRGALATIFLEHVRAVASRTGVDRASLLGRVIAHEVGHLLHGKEGHGRSGIMREVWTGEELSLNRRGDWVFGLPEQRQLRGVLNDELSASGSS
jgi:hypothetical protein